jgi:hypothetical protein
MIRRDTLNIEDTALQVLAAMEQHPRHEAIAEACVAALSGMLPLLASNGTARLAIIGIGGHKLLLRAQRSFAHVKVVQQQGTEVLEGLCASDPNCLRGI